VLVLLTVPAAAQTREPIPWFAVDVHGATVGLPTAEGWVPAVSADTPLPGRGWGVAGGVTVYPLRLGVATFGVGASLSTTRATGSGLNETGAARPIVRTEVLNLLPQLSVNFGHRLGWSYLSAGLGRTKVTSSADATATTPQVMVPEAWNQALNFGGGARWFMRPRLGFGFDVRFVKLGSRGATALLPSARRTQMITVSAGITIQ
jgi:hypothetical protein